MFINELFTRPTQWEYTKDSPDKIRAQFIIDDYIYKVYINRDASDSFEMTNPTEVFPGTWDITFSISPTDGPGDGWGEEDNITDTGNAIAVFSTVIDIIIETAELKNITTLFFSADEPSRIKLYDRMSRHFTKKGWRYLDDKEIGERSGRTPNSHLFLLTKQPNPHEGK